MFGVIWCSRLSWEQLAPGDLDIVPALSVLELAVWLLLASGFNPSQLGVFGYDITLWKCPWP